MRFGLSPVDVQGDGRLLNPAPLREGFGPSYDALRLLFCVSASLGYRRVGAPAAIGQLRAHAVCRAAFTLPVGRFWAGSAGSGVSHVLSFAARGCPVVLWCSGLTRRTDIRVPPARRPSACPVYRLRGLGTGLTRAAAGLPAAGYCDISGIFGEPSMSGRSRDTLRSRSRALPLTPPLQSFGCGPYRSAWGVSRFAASGMYCTDIGMNRQYRNRYVMIDLCGYWVCTAKQAQKSPVARGLCWGSAARLADGAGVGRLGYSRPSSASVSCSVFMRRSTSSGGISTQVVETGRPADVLAVCLSPMSVLPASTRVRTLVNWSKGAGVMSPSLHEKARTGRACNGYKLMLSQILVFAASILLLSQVQR